MHPSRLKCRLSQLCARAAAVAAAVAVAAVAAAAAAAAAAVAVDNQRADHDRRGTM